jgi:hypothetical protein
MLGEQIVEERRVPRPLSQKGTFLRCTCLYEEALSEGLMYYGAHLLYSSSIPQYAEDTDGKTSAVS